MKVSPNGQKLIKSHESCRLTAYKPHSKDRWTVGFGNTFYEDGSAVRQGDKITQDRADYLFRIILGDFEMGVMKLLKVEVTQNQFDALVSFAYNVGLEDMKTSTLLRKVNLNPKDPSIKKEFMRWVNSGGKKLTGLVNRRQSESDLFFT
jgi:lysozyme